MATLETIRNTIKEELQAATYPLNLVMTEMPGALNTEQRQALESVQVALQRLAVASEKTSTSAMLNQKKGE